MRQVRQPTSQAGSTRMFIAIALDSFVLDSFSIMAFGE